MAPIRRSTRCGGRCARARRLARRRAGGAAAGGLLRRRGLARADLRRRGRPRGRRRARRRRRPPAAGGLGRAGRSHRRAARRARDRRAGSRPSTSPGPAGSRPPPDAPAGPRWSAARPHPDSPILLGHTLDDQAETVLLGLGRGSGARSIAGMRTWDPPWLRPLLSVRRSVTRAACAELDLPVWDDPHNVDPRFTRVRLRHEVLPLLEDVLAGGVAEALARTAAQLREDADALDAVAAALLAEALRPALTHTSAGPHTPRDVCADPTRCVSPAGGEVRRAGPRRARRRSACAASPRVARVARRRRCDWPHRRPPEGSGRSRSSGA